MEILDQSVYKTFGHTDLTTLQQKDKKTKRHTDKKTKRRRDKKNLKNKRQIRQKDKKRRLCGFDVISHKICNHKIFLFWCNIS